MPRESQSMWPPHHIQARNGAKFSDWACKLVVALSQYINPPTNYDEISSAMAHFYKEANQPPHMQELCEQLRNAPPGIYDQLFLDEVETEVGYWREKAQTVINGWRRKEGNGSDFRMKDDGSDSDYEPHEAITPPTPKESKKS